MDYFLFPFLSCREYTMVYLVRLIYTSIYKGKNMQNEHRRFSFRATYRVLVLKTRQPSQPHERVLAICLDQNLVGRGEDLDLALADLTKTLAHSIASDWEELHPAYVPDPDPELLEIFEGRCQQTSGGDLVLRRLKAIFAFDLEELPSKKIRRKPRLIFEECLA
jgi:hypothetical protein